MLRRAYWLTLFLSITGPMAQTVEITATRARARQLDTGAQAGPTLRAPSRSEAAP